MGEELSNGELGRQIESLQRLISTRFAELNSRLDKVVSQDVYAIQSGHVEQRLAQLGTDIQQCKDAADKLEDDFERYQISERDRREADRQRRLYQAVVPILLALLAAVIAVWTAVGT